jgi:hypothetical protein
MFGFRVILRVLPTCFLEICQVGNRISGILMQGKNGTYNIAFISTFVAHVYLHHCNVHNTAVLDSTNCI